MSHELIALNSDLQRLQNEGYEVEIADGHLILHHIPYVDVDKKIRYGTLAAPLNLSGYSVLKPTSHTIMFSGQYPCYADGSEITAIRHQEINKNIAGNIYSFSFSNKPPQGYTNYYDKFKRYAEIISQQAYTIDNSVTANSFKPIVQGDDPIFCYQDTNSSRAGITHISNKLRGHKVGIVGIGGTGSYILDLVAKTPVSEIHVFDNDVFCQHNAFRAPGAASLEELNQHSSKVEYFAHKYAPMRKGIISHRIFLDDNTLNLLDDLDTVFLSIDSGDARQVISEYLDNRGIHYIDSGISASVCNDSILGAIRVTEYTASGDHRKYLPFINSEDDVYQSNIQIVELNALAAIFSVIQWKKHVNFYQDVSDTYNLVYDTNDGELKT